MSVSVNGVEVIRAVDYFAFGEVRSWDYGSSGQYRRAYDRDGRIRQHSAGAGQRSLSFDPASRITAIADDAAAGSAQDWSFDYDDLDRITEAHNAATVGSIANVELNWAYDGTGNRTSETRNADPPIPYTIDPASNRLQQVGSNPRQHDAVGNTLNDGTGTTSRYNARNRLIEVSRAGLTSTYAHNAFGERVCKAIDHAGPCAQAPDRIEYVYDVDGRLIGEYPVGGSSANAVEYLWLDDTPIAVLQRRPGSTNGGPTGGGSATAWNGTQAGGMDLYHLQPDHLDTPRVVLNANNQPIWRWDSAPFGDTLANEQPSGGLTSYTLNLRFPGQQYDAETGTHYNYFRDYEPGSGRYLQSDPIGLRGGLNVYAYSDLEPIFVTDPDGLKGLSLRIRSWWTNEEKQYGRAKINCLKRAARDGRLVKTTPRRTGTASSHYSAATGAAVPPGQEVDHLVDLQLGGCETCGSNLFPTSPRVNRSFGAQIGNQLRTVATGTAIDSVTVRRR
ncbi:MAG: RHS repeat-associated core domain-containing protein [Lysobacterales bacterium]